MNPQFPPTTLVTPWNGDGVVAGIPQHLRVVVGVDVHEPGGHHEPVGVDRPRRVLVDRADRDHTAVAHADVGSPSRAARAVHYLATADLHVEHGAYPLVLTGLSLKR